MGLIVSILFLVLILFAVTAFFLLRERRYLKKKTSEAMSPAVWREIVKERETSLQKRRQFRDALEIAKKRITQK